eukprot:scaffold12240_cov76-Skeletonema_dohrnii-CCMP3373.AAC.3
MSLGWGRRPPSFNSVSETFLLCRPRRLRHRTHPQFNSNQATRGPSDTCLSHLKDSAPQSHYDRGLLGT